MPVPSQPERPDPVIKPVEHADLPNLIAFLERNDSPETVRNFNPIPLNATTAEDILRPGNKDRYYIAKTSERIVGLTMLRGWNEGFDTPSFGVLVDDSVRGRGLG